MELTLFEASDDHQDRCRHCGQDLTDHVQVDLEEGGGDGLACPPGYQDNEITPEPPPRRREYPPPGWDDEDDPRWGPA
jgi:hypothetical protein